MPPLIPPIVEPYYLGIDPGSSGGIAILHGTSLVHLASFRDTPLEDIWTTSFAPLASSTVPIHCIIEKVGTFIPLKSKSKIGAPGKYMFKFGWYAGVVEAYMSVLRTEMTDLVQYSKVSPQTWQGYYSLPKKSCVKKSHWKRALKEEAIKLYGTRSITLDTADAVLIAHYCKFLYGAKRKTK